MLQENQGNMLQDVQVHHFPEMVPAQPPRSLQGSCHCLPVIILHPHKFQD